VDHIGFAHNGSAVMTNQNTYDNLCEGVTVSVRVFGFAKAFFWARI
jgi:hypothetical protein